MQRTPIMAIQPTGEEIRLAEVVTAPPAGMEAEPAAVLPTTASTLPLIGLMACSPHSPPEQHIATHSSVRYGTSGGTMQSC